MKTYFIENIDFDDKTETFAVFSEREIAEKEFRNFATVGDFDLRLELNEYDASEIIDFKNRKGTNLLKAIKKKIEFDEEESEEIVDDIVQLLGDVGNIAGAE